MNLRGLLKFVSGNLERKTLLFVLVPLTNIPGLFWNACLRLFLVPGNLRLALQSDLKSDFALE